MFSNVSSLVGFPGSCALLLFLHLDLKVAGGYETGFCLTSGHLLDGIEQPILDAMNEAHQQQISP